VAEELNFSPDEARFVRERYEEMLRDFDDPGRPFATCGGRLHVKACRYVLVPTLGAFAQGGVAVTALPPGQAAASLLRRGSMGPCRVCRPDPGA
jgi:hypothetical protein